MKARKAALAKQNAERAESFIEGLLSASAASDLQAQGGQGSGSLGEVPHSASMSKSSSSGSYTQSGKDQAASGTSAAKSPSQPTSDLEDYETAIEASSTAPAAPLPSTSTSLSVPTSRPAPPRRTSSSTASQSHRSFHPNRPVAIDFESDPASSLPNVPRWTKQLIESQRRRNDSLRNGGMVIDLSDSEEEDEDEGGEEDDDEDGGQSDEGTLDQPENLDEELRQAVKESRAQDAQNHAAFYQVSNTPYPSYSLTNTFTLSRESSNTGKEQMPRASPAPPSSLPRSRRVSPMPSGGSTSKASSSFSHHITSPPSRSVTVTASVNANSSGAAASRDELEAKQAEIKKMLEMIKKLEGKKKQKQKQGVGTSSTSNASSRAGTPSKAFTEEQKAKNVTSQLVEADLQKATIQAAKDRVDRLIDEKQKLVESAPLSHAATANGDAPESDMEEGQVGEEATPEPLLEPAVESKRDNAPATMSSPSSSLPAPSRRDSSSSEAAMSISSGD